MRSAADELLTTLTLISDFASYRTKTLNAFVILFRIWFTVKLVEFRKITIINRQRCKPDCNLQLFVILVDEVIYYELNFWIKQNI